MAEDRNAKARREFELAQQQRQINQAQAAFALDFGAGRAAAIDRNGMKIAKGQLVLWSPPPGFTYWQVVDVKPNTNGNVPPGVVTVVLAATVPLNYRANQPCGDLLIIGKTEEAGAIEPGEMDGEQVADVADVDGVEEPLHPPMSTTEVEADAAAVPAGPRLVTATDE